MTQQTKEPQAIRLTGAAYQNFLNTWVAPKTKSSYEYNIKGYMQHTHAETPDELLADPKSKTPYTARQIEDSIASYIIYLAEQGMSTATMQLALWSLKFFFEKANRTPLAWAYLSGKIPQKDKKRAKAYTLEQMRLMLLHSNPREKAIMLLLASTGLRVGAISPEYGTGGKLLHPGLQFKHLHRLDEVLPDEPEYTQLRKFGGYLVQAYPGTPDEYYTFTTPEAREAIDLYRTLRERQGEVVTDDSPVFRDVFDRRGGGRANTPTPLDLDTIKLLFTRLQREIRMRPDYQKGATKSQNARIRHEVKAVHGFRKFTDTVLTNRKLHPDFRKFLMGHDNGLQENYYDFTGPQSVAELLTEYLKAVEGLTVSAEDKLRLQAGAASAENAQLQAQVKDQKQQLEQADAIVQALKGIPDSVMQQLLAAAGKK